MVSPWVKVSTIIPEFRILRLSLKMLDKGDHNSLSDLFSVFLRAIYHLNLKLRISSGYTASFKMGVWKVQDFGNFELFPCIS